MAKNIEAQQTMPDFTREQKVDMLARYINRAAEEYRKAMDTADERARKNGISGDEIVARSYQLWEEQKERSNN